MEPFSTFVFKVLIWIFTTTNKICIRGRFTQAPAKSFITTPMPSYPSELQYLLWQLSIGTTLERHPFSRLVHSAGVSLHILKRVPTSMATALLSRSTNTFFAVWWASIKCLNSAFGLSYIASSAYQFSLPFSFKNRLIIRFTW